MTDSFPNAALLQLIANCLSPQQSTVSPLNSGLPPSPFANANTPENPLFSRYRSDSGYTTSSPTAFTPPSMESPIYGNPIGEMVNSPFIEQIQNLFTGQIQHHFNVVEAPSLDQITNSQMVQSPIPQTPMNHYPTITSPIPNVSYDIAELIAAPVSDGSRVASLLPATTPTFNFDHFVVDPQLQVDFNDAVDMNGFDSDDELPEAPPAQNPDAIDYNFIRQAKLKMEEYVGAWKNVKTPSIENAINYARVGLNFDISTASQTKIDFEQPDLTQIIEWHHDLKKRMPWRQPKSKKNFKIYPFQTAPHSFNYNRIWYATYCKSGNGEMFEKMQSFKEVKTRMTCLFFCLFDFFVFSYCWECEKAIRAAGLVGFDITRDEKNCKAANVPQLYFQRTVGIKRLLCGQGCCGAHQSKKDIDNDILLSVGSMFRAYPHLLGIWVANGGQVDAALNPTNFDEMLVRRTGNIKVDAVGGSVTKLEEMEGSTHCELEMVWIEYLMS